MDRISVLIVLTTSLCLTTAQVCTPRDLTAATPQTTISTEGISFFRCYSRQPCVWLAYCRSAHLLRHATWLPGLFRGPSKPCVFTSWWQHLCWGLLRLW